MNTSDVALIMKPARSVCPNRWLSTATTSVTISYPTAAPTACPTTSSSSSGNYFYATVGLSVACGILGITSVVFALMWWSLRLTAATPKLTSQENQA